MLINMLHIKKFILWSLIWFQSCIWMIICFIFGCSFIIARPGTPNLTQTLSETLVLTLSSRERVTSIRKPIYDCHFKLYLLPVSRKINNWMQVLLMLFRVPLIEKVPNVFDEAKLRFRKEIKGFKMNIFA